MQYSGMASLNIAAQLLREKEEKQELEAVIEVFQANRQDTTEADLPTGRNIPRPKGTCSKDWGLQTAMGLSGSPSKDAKYAALLVS